MDKTRLKKLILPLVLEQLLAVSVGFADTFMVSKVGQQAVAGVSLVDNINMLIMQVMAAFAAGGTVVISQYIGEKNTDMAKKACTHLEMLMGAFAVTIMTICIVLGKHILGFLFGTIEDSVMTAARIYMMVSGISFVFWAFYSSGAAVLRCQENTKTSMKISVFMNILNVILNAVFVFIFNMGVLGVAVATLISRAFAGIIMKVIMSSESNILKITDRQFYALKLNVIKKILSIGIPSGIENGMFHVGKLALNSMISTLGTAVIAANAIAYQIIELPNIPGNTIGLALVVIIGQDIGAGEKDRAVSDTKYLIKRAYIGDWACKACLFILAPFIVPLFNLEPEGVSTAVQVLRCFCIASILVWPLSFTLPSALRGAGDVKYSMVVSVISMWMCRVVVSMILVKVFNLGILGIWIGMFADWYVRGIGYLLRFKSRKWLDKKVI